MTGGVQIPNKQGLRNTRACELSMQPRAKGLSATEIRHVVETHPNMVKLLLQFLYRDEGGFMINAKNMEILQTILVEQNLLSDGSVPTYMNLPGSYFATLKNFDSYPEQGKRLIAEKLITKVFVEKFYLDSLNFRKPNDQIIRELSDTALFYGLTLDKVKSLRNDLFLFFATEENKMFFTDLIKSNLEETVKLYYVKSDRYGGFGTLGVFSGVVTAFVGLIGGMAMNSAPFMGEIMLMGWSGGYAVSYLDNFMQYRATRKHQKKLAAQVDKTTQLLFGTSSLDGGNVIDIAPSKLGDGTRITADSQVKLTKIGAALPVLVPTTKISEIQSYGKDLLDAEMGINEQLFSIPDDINSIPKIDWDFHAGDESNQDKKIDTLLAASDARAPVLRSRLESLDLIAGNIELLMEKWKISITIYLRMSISLL